MVLSHPCLLVMVMHSGSLALHQHGGLGQRNDTQAGIDFQGNVLPITGRVANVPISDVMGHVDAQRYETSIDALGDVQSNTGLVTIAAFLEEVPKYKVGQRVEALYKDGVWYKATIEKIKNDDTYKIEWGDGALSDRVKREAHIRPKYRVGERVEGSCKDGRWCKATIDKINLDGTYTLKWHDGGTQDTVKAEANIRAKYKTGDRVEGFWKKHGEWYKGTINSVNDDGKYTMRWDYTGKTINFEPE